VDFLVGRVKIDAAVGETGENGERDSNRRTRDQERADGKPLLSLLQGGEGGGAR